MRYCIEENGVCVNVVISDSALAENWHQQDNVEINWLWDGEKFNKPPEDEE